MINFTEIPTWMYLGGMILIFILTFGIIWWRQKTVPLAFRRIIGLTIVCYGLYLATLTGTHTQFRIPGSGFFVSTAASAAIGAGTGAAIGWGTWLVLDTVGIVTGGTGFALGGIAMATISALVGGVSSGVASGAGTITDQTFWTETITYPLISPWFWDPVLLIGILFFFGKQAKSNKPLKNNESNSIL